MTWYSSSSSKKSTVNETKICSVDKDFLALGFNTPNEIVHPNGIKILLPKEEDKNSKNYCVVIPNVFTFYMVDKEMALDIVKKHINKPFVPVFPIIKQTSFKHEFSITDFEKTKVEIMSKPKRKYKEQHKLVYELHEQGKTFQEIANQMGISRQAVHQKYQSYKSYLKKAV